MPPYNDQNIDRTNFITISPLVWAVEQCTNDRQTLYLKQLFRAQGS